MSGQRWFKEHSEEREQRHTGEQAHGGPGGTPSPRQDPGTAVRVVAAGGWTMSRQESGSYPEPSSLPYDTWPHLTCVKTLLLVERSGSQEGGGDRRVRGTGRVLQDCRVWELRGRVPAGTTSPSHWGWEREGSGEGGW